MTDRLAGVRRDPGLLKRTLAWSNEESAAVPAFGVVRLDSFNDTTGMYGAKKYDGTSLLVYTNGPAAVAQGGKGGSLDWSESRRVLVSSDVTFGTEVGPVDDSWEMTPSGSGFVVFSNRDGVTGTAAVIKLGGGGSTNIFHGRVHESHGKGYYTVELRSWSGSTPDCEGDPNCTPCRQVTGSLSTSVDDICGEITLPEPLMQTSEISPPVFVLAYHRASYYVPLLVDTDCILADLGDSNPISDALSGLSSSGGGYGDEPVYQILDGVQTHTVQYKDTYECCGTGEDVLTKRTAIIFAALVCDEVICNPCNGA